MENTREEELKKWNERCAKQLGITVEELEAREKKIRETEYENQEQKFKRFNQENWYARLGEFAEHFKKLPLEEKREMVRNGYVRMPNRYIGYGNEMVLDVLERANLSNSELVELYRPMLITNTGNTNEHKEEFVKDALDKYSYDDFYNPDDFRAEMKFIFKKINSDILLGYLEAVKGGENKKAEYLDKLMCEIGVPADNKEYCGIKLEDGLLCDFVEYILFKDKKVWIEIKNPEEFLKTAPGIDDGARKRAIRNLDEKRQNIAQKIEYADEAADAGDEGARSLLLKLDPSQIPYIKQHLTERIKVRKEEALQVKKNAETFSSSQNTKFEYIDDILSTEKRIKESCRQTE